MDIQELVSDVKFVKFVINRCMPIHKFYELLDMQWSYDHNVFCPFHDNSNTPSARLYKNADGSTTLWCFSEQKMYRPSDFITKELVNLRLESVFYKLWRQLPQDYKDSLLNNYNLDSDYIPQQWKDALPELEKFKQGKINISEFRLLVLKNI